MLSSMSTLRWPQATDHFRPARRHWTTAADGLEGLDGLEDAEELEGLDGLEDVEDLEDLERPEGPVPGASRTGRPSAVASLTAVSSSRWPASASPGCRRSA
jgi:hypothetical protein